MLIATRLMAQACKLALTAGLFCNPPARVVPGALVGNAVGSPSSSLEAVGVLEVSKEESWSLGVGDDDDDVWPGLSSFLRVGAADGGAQKRQVYPNQRDVDGKTSLLSTWGDELSSDRVRRMVKLAVGTKGGSLISGT